MVGTVTKLITLNKLVHRKARIHCDVAEVRLDKLNHLTRHWEPSCRTLSEHGLPLIFTVRQQDEGGEWVGSRGDRERLFQSVLPICSGLDVELASDSADTVVRLAQSQEKVPVVSFHDFVGTPPYRQLEEIVQRGAAFGEVIVKIATLIETLKDMACLERLLGEYAEKISLCVLGMGPLGPKSRTSFPSLGSCLTYGYLDSSVAPGQVSAQELFKAIHKNRPSA